MVSSVTKTVLIILGIIIILGGASSVFYFTSDSEGFPTGSAQCSGGQVLSIDDVSVRYSNEFNKEVIRVLFSTVPTAECLDVFVSRDQLEDAIDGFDAKSSIRGDIVLTKKDVEFNINEDQNDKFFKYDINQISGGLICSDSDCSSAGVSNPLSSIAESTLFSDKCNCVEEDLKGVGGSFSSGSILVWETDISIGSESVTLDNSVRSGRVGNIAVAKWAGNLAGDIGFSRPNRDAYKPFIDNKFRMIDAGTHNSLENTFNSLRQPLISGGTPGSIGGVETLGDARAYNAFFDSETANGLSSWVSQEPNVKSASISSNILTVNLNSPIIYPQFTLDIVAEEVGIFISTGKPQVDCPSNFDIISGDEKDVHVILQNIGQDSGSFSYGLNCNRGSSVVSPTPPRNIVDGGSLIVNARMGLTVEEGTQTASCTFTATELNTFEEDTCTFSFTSTKQNQCISGTASCEDGNSQLWTCLPDGSFSKVDCGFGCEAFEDSSRCRLQQNEICDDGIDNDGDTLIDLDDPECAGVQCGAWVEIAGVTIIPDLFCIINNFFLKFRMIFSIIAGVIAGALGISYLLKFLPRKSKTKTKVISSIVAFVLIGAAIFVLALIYFWWIIAFLVVVGVARAILPGV